MDSMEQIYSMHAKTVYRFLLSRSQNHDLAEELTQETFYQAVKNFDKFKGKSSISTWLCGIAKNLFLEHNRKHVKQVSLSDVDEVQIESTEIEFFRTLDNMGLLKSLHSLEEPMREVIYLRLIGNLTFAQIGEIMERNENWARVTFYRGKEKLIGRSSNHGTKNSL